MRYNTCSDVSKISYGFFLRGHLGQLVPQHDVTAVCTHHSYVIVVHTLRVAENEILKLDLPAKRHYKR
jgi:hypothetical protein